MEAGTRSSSGGRATRTSRQEREREFSRLLAFSDGVFAIAITLLVLQLEVPESAHELGGALQDELPDLFAFALSFAVLGSFWWRFHHRLFSGLAEFDGPLVALNFLYLALVTIVPFTSEVLGDYGDEPQAVILYAVNLGSLGLVGGIMVRYAFSRRLMEPDALTEQGPGGYSNWLMPIVFFGTVPLALIDPTAATLVWLVGLVLLPQALRRWRGTGDGH